MQKHAAQAAIWYRKAADQNDARAMSALAYPYSQGIGVQKDDAEALK